MQRLLLPCLALGLLFLLVSCSPPTKPTGPQFEDDCLALRDFAGKPFDPVKYRKSMVWLEQEGIWMVRVRGASFSAADVVNLGSQAKPLLQPHKKIDVKLLQHGLEATLLQRFPKSQPTAPGRSLTMKAIVVEAKPGNRLARYLVGIMGAGKASASIVVEIFEPNQKRPTMRFYGKGSRGSGKYGGDSQALLQDIITDLAETIASRLSKELASPDPS